MVDRRSGNTTNREKILVLLFLVFCAFYSIHQEASQITNKLTNDYNQQQHVNQEHNDDDVIQCFPWAEEADKWWEYHPDWEFLPPSQLPNENSDSNNNSNLKEQTNTNQLCFAKMKDIDKASFFQKLHSLQYNNTNCPNVHTTHMWSSGWAADLNNVADGLAYTLLTGRPYQIHPSDRDDDGGKWHYAAFKKQYRNGRKPVCESADMFCYFLPLGSCHPSSSVSIYANNSTAPRYGTVRIYRLEHQQWLTEYVTRPQQWLRRRVMDYVSKNTTSSITMTELSSSSSSISAAASSAEFSLSSLSSEQCAVVHIRRTDVVLHGRESRQYFPVKAYLDEIQNLSNRTNIRNILLFTDDANAIDEALEFHSMDYNFLYLNRKRYRGSEGGFENQIPSDSPADEVVMLLSIFELAKMCNVIVHSSSGLSSMMYNAMVSSSHSEEDVIRIEIDRDMKKRKEENSASEVGLQEELDKARNGTNKMKDYS